MENLDIILEGCRIGDRASQEKLYRRFYPGLFALCKKFFHDDHEVLTALNNGMMRVFENISGYDPNRGEVFNWAYTIVRNAALTHLRNLDNHRVAADLIVTPDAGDDNPFKVLEWKDIYYYLDQLPAATRVICSLYYLEGFLVREIGMQLNISEGTVKWHLSESRSRLKKIFTKTAIIKSA